MPATNLHLEDLLAPTSRDEFLSDFWEQQPLHLSRAASGAYPGLFALSDLDQVIAFTRPKFNDPSAFEDAPTGRSSYVRGTLDPAAPASGDNPGIPELAQAFAQGKSLVIMAMQHRWPAIARLCRNLELEFRCPVHANLYLTPAGSQGFSAHFDPHEVFVLQLEGCKTWRVYETPTELPITTESQPVDQGRLGTSRNMILRPGDFLYLPRGCVHEAFTTDTHSLHITVGINVYRWTDLLRHILASASRRQIGFRESIPDGALPDDRSQWKAHIQDLLEQLADAASRDEVLDEAWHSLGDQFFGQMGMLPESRFAAEFTPHPIDLETVMENQAWPLSRVIEDEREVAIEFPGNRVAGPRRIAPALRFIASAKQFAVGSLPGNVNDAAKVVLTRRLVREGMLTIAAEPKSIHMRNQGGLSNDLEEETASETHWEGPSSGKISLDAEVNVES